MLHVFFETFMGFCWFFAGCALDLGLISSEDLQKIVSGVVKEGSEEENEIAVKVSLEFINLLTNIHDIRKDATHSALMYLFTHSKNNDFGGTTGLKRKSMFDVIDNEEGNPGSKLSKISTTVVNKGCSKVDSTITVETSIDKYELDDFSIDDMGVLTFDDDLMFN